MTRIAPHPLFAALSAALMIGSASIGALPAFAPSGAAPPESRANVAPAERAIASPIVVGTCDDGDDDSLDGARDRRGDGVDPVPTR
jgi:hypothetical protein